VWITYASWWCWWLGGSFGFRGFIEYYALLALPLAWGLQHVSRSRPWVRLLGTGLLVLMMFFNVKLSRQYQWPWEGPDWTWHKVWNEYAVALVG
jgi:hypothetical protein